jgi:hypothetical protein
MLSNSDGYEPPGTAVPRWSPAARIAARNVRSVKLSVGVVIFAALAILFCDVMCHPDNNKRKGETAKGRMGHCRVIDSPIRPFAVSFL